MKLYTPIINKALTLAYNAHHGQLDACGVPYFCHPLAVAEMMDTEDEILTAILHDVAEDTTVTFADLEREGIPPAVLDALRLLTHGDGEPYLDYVQRIAKNPLAAKVKLADLRHNSDERRNGQLPESERERYRKKYTEAIDYLKSLYLYF